MDRELDFRAPAQPADAAAVEELYRAHGKTVSRWAARLAGPGIDIEDIVQDVFVVVHEQLPRFRGDSNITTWLFGITANVVRHRRRKERVRRWLLRLAAAEPPTVPARPTPVEAMLRTEALTTVYRALEAMPDKYRTPFVLFEIEGMSGQQIAELTGVHPSTLRVHLLRARERFAAAVAVLEAKEKK